MKDTTITTTICPRNTPWGHADETRKIIPGIWKVYTPSHGGWYIAPELHALMPAAIQATPYSRGGWFEEDCDWAIPCVFFWDLLKPVLTADTFSAAESTLKGSYDGRYGRMVAPWLFEADELTSPEGFAS